MKSLKNDLWTRIQLAFIFLELLILAVHHSHLYALGFSTLAICMLYVVVQRSVNKILDRLHEVEEFTIMCAWCGKVEQAGAYINVSHGVCPTCFDREVGNLKEV